MRDAILARGLAANHSPVRRRVAGKSMFSTLTRVSLVLSLMLIAPGAVVVAQSASIAGVVRDGNGGVIPGVSVTTIPQSGGLLRHTASGSDGSYRFDGLPDGTYRVDFDLRGFELVRRNHVRVSRDTEANVDAALPPRMICECITLEPPSPWAQRPGQVVDMSGRPLPHARIQLVGREDAYTDNEGRFFIRVPVYESWPLTASDTGFRSITERVSGADSATVVLSLEHENTTGVPDVQRFGGCECSGYLLPYGGR